MLDQNQSMLVIIDVQGKLAEAMHEKDGLLANIGRLAETAKALDVPVLVTEQLPDKLGPTRTEIAEVLQPECHVVSKSAFSCCGEPAFIRKLEAFGKNQIVLCGIEAHICVLQTALDLLAGNHEVFVVADAVSSRSPCNKQVALDRMQRNGTEITVVESVMFEWLRDAKHPAFREVRKLLA